ncbi:MAG: 1-acyl-sn-glycerol-3-phosphate acyltransferase [Oscillospiraceae bacterium]|nr:1-acyl-sn-glycerol-3-phosphate acyltransferase [Oscillospiraceae bacterium]
MKSSYRFYKGCYRIARVMLSVLYGLSVKGRENIPHGAFLVCANHSSTLDPIFIAMACGIENHMHIIAKAELYRVPVLSAIVQKLGAIRVDRGIMDMNTIKETLSYLKSGEKVAIFPEGTRNPEKNVVSAKSGAVKIAERADVPIVPIYIPRKKPLFRKVHLVIGEVYAIETINARRSPNEYKLLVDALMDKIEALNPELCANNL